MKIKPPTLLDERDSRLFKDGNMTVIVELEVLDCPLATEEEIEKDIRYAEDMIGMNCYYKIKSISFD